MSSRQGQGAAGVKGADDLALRVAVPGGGSRFSDQMFFDGEFAADDEQATFGDFVKVVVDPSRRSSSTGDVDYKDGLDQSGSATTI